MKKSLPPPERALLQQLKPGLKLLLAVSGGRDSVALLHACAAIAALYRLQLEVAHVDHGLRKESRADAAFVRTLAASYALPFHLKRAPRRPARTNLEDWARKVRYDYFSSVLKRRNLQYVLTAHNANDQAETLLMRLIQNREFSGICRQDPRRRLLRPFLGLERSEIEAYIRRNQLRFVEDKSNQDTALLRNRIRHRLLPYLRRNFDAAAVRSLAARAIALGDDADCLQACSRKLAEPLRGLRFGSREWLRSLQKVLSGAEEALSFRLLNDLFHTSIGQTLGRRSAALLRAFLRGAAPKFELPGGYILTRRAGGMLLHRSRK